MAWSAPLRQLVVSEPPGPTGRSRWRWARPSSLGRRFVTVSVLLVLFTGVLVGIAGVTLIRRTNEASARRVLAVLADTDQARGGNVVAAPAVRDMLDSLRVRRAVLTASEQYGPALARGALTPSQVQAVLGGRSLSLRVETDTGTVLVEARPVAHGAIVLAQNRGDGLGFVDSVLPAYVLALIAAVAVAALVAVLVAWRVSDPLRRLSRAAAALEQGRRDVQVQAGGPAEVVGLATELQRLTHSLARAEEAQRDFLLSISHDLRTPLTTIGGYAEALRDGAVPVERVGEVGRSLVGEAARLTRMVGDLLDLARLEAGSLSFREQLINPAEVVAEAAQAWSAQCAAREVSLESELPGPGAAGSGLVVLADPDRLRQAIDGLIDNAVRLTPAGGSVVLAVRAGPDGSALIEVRDSGPGLSDDDLAVAFEPGELAQRYRDRRPGGAGLGLTLVRRLVEGQRGTITADHASEGGLCMQLRLPGA